MWRACALLGLYACAPLDARSGPGTTNPPGVIEADPVVGPLLELRDEEANRRRNTDHGSLFYDDEAFGAEPHRVVGLEDGRALGLARGAARVVLFDRELAPAEQAPGPRLGTGLGVSAGIAFAAGELDRRIFRYRVSDHLQPIDSIELEEVEYGLDALEVGAAGTLYATARNDERLFVIERGTSVAPRSTVAGALGKGPHRLVATPRHLVALCGLGHALVVWELGPSGLPTGRAWRQEQDGPFWGMRVALRHDELLIFATGVENSALDRRGGSFGFIDSFLYVYGFAPSRGLWLEHAIDTSEHGVVTPRAMDLRVGAGAVSATVHGFGSPRSLRAELREGATPRVDSSPRWPGTADVVRVGAATLSANSLLDAWVVERPGETPKVFRETSRDRRACLERLGEALAFTTLIAPHNRSEGALSRFTCETCHFEGTIDGRVHHTGRGAVRVTTKPLRGLFNNPPYFSRALDRDLTEMVHNEFRVAGSGSGTDPWFALKAAEHPWLAELGCGEPGFSPAQLRRALVLYFMRATHSPNARALRARSWSRDELAGARVFLERCERCHEARLATHDPASRVPLQRWSELVFSEAGPIVWASERYAVTGVEPRVHPLGTRVPSLRRIAYESPYFTNGSATSLGELLDGVCFDAERFYHHVGGARAEGELAPDDGGCGADAGLRRLTAGERAALGAFLSLL